MKKIDDHDNAIIGIAIPWQCSEEILVYSGKVIIDNLVKDGMTEEEAIEYIDFNIEGAYVGEDTPIIVWDYLNDE